MGDEPGRLSLRKVSRLPWVAGVLVAAAGGCVLLVAMGLVGGSTTFTLPSRVGVGLLGSLVFALGAWVCWRAPFSALVVDRAAQAVTLTRRGWFRTITEQYPADTIADVRVTKERAKRGIAVYRVELVLHTGNVVPISLIPPRDRDGCMRAAEHLGTALGLPRT